MAGDRKSVGSKGRIGPAQSGGVPGGDLVTVTGWSQDTVGTGSEVGTSGFVKGSLDGRALDFGFDNSRWLASAALNYMVRNSDHTLTDRQRGEGDNADGVAVNTLGVPFNMARNSIFNGASWDRSRSGSAANLAAFSSAGASLQTPPGMWSITHTPAVATKATITRALVAGTRHVCTSISARLTIPDGVNQPAIQVNLRDGATGAGTILWSETLGIGAVSAQGQSQEIKLSGLNIFGTAGTAMTLEFSAAGAATTLESVAMTGYDAS